MMKYPADEAIHAAIARVFVDHHVGYGGRPVLMAVLVRLTANKLGHARLDPTLAFKIASIISNSDKYLIIKRDKLDTVIANR